MSRLSTIRLTPERRQQIVAAIRAGSYPPIAAQAFGVPAATLAGWVRRGRDPGAREPFRSFARAIDQAHAQARLKAEMEIFREEPEIWLEHGPGRDRAEQPGWSTAVKPTSLASAADNALTQPAVIAAIDLIQAELMNYPEARERLSQRFNELGLPRVG